MSTSEIRNNWTARKGLRYEFLHVNDNTWLTSLRTIEQLGVPGLEGDAWRVELEDSPTGVSEAAMKVFRSDFDMEHLLNIIANHDDKSEIYELLPVAARSFFAEAKFSFVHPHVIMPHAYGQIANRNVILMPVIEGDNLTEYIQKNPDLNTAHRMKLCRELCTAVQALHEEGGYLHNDIKPDNIMVKVDESGVPSITLIDMGFSCSIPDVEKVYGEVKKSVGTEGYIAPEVRRGSARWVSEASDVWSVGCTLFFILTSLELVSGVLDHKSEESQNELYQRLLDNMNEPLVKSDRMQRAGINSEQIAEGLEVLLTPSLKSRKPKNRPLQKMIELCSEDVKPTPSKPEPEPEPVPEILPVPELPEFSDELVKVHLRPEEGMKQIIVLTKRHSAISIGWHDIIGIKYRQ